MRQPVDEQHRALSYEKSQLSSDLWSVKPYADRRNRLNVRQCGMLDDEREQDAEVFAEVEEAGVRVDCADSPGSPGE